MQYVARYDLKPYKAEEFMAWLEENEAAYAENAMEGWTYLGTWGTVHQLGRFDFETRWELVIILSSLKLPLALGCSAEKGF